MTLDAIVISLTVAALGAAGIVEAIRAAVNGIWPARTASLRWVWRTLSVIAGGLLGYASGGSVEAMAIGLGAGTLTTAVVGGLRSRIANKAPGDPRAEEIER